MGIRVVQKGKKWPTQSSALILLCQGPADTLMIGAGDRGRYTRSLTVFLSSSIQVHPDWLISTNLGLRYHLWS